MSGTSGDVHGELRWFQIRWPERVDVKDIISYFDTLFASGAGSVVLRIESGRVVEGHRTRDDARIKHHVGAPAGKIAQVVALLERLVPGIVTVPLDSAADPETPQFGKPLKPAFRVSTELSVTSRNREIGGESAGATAAALLTALGEVGRSESATIEWHLGRTLTAQIVPTRAFDPGSGSWARDLLIAPFRAPRELDSEARRALAGKLSERRVLALGRIAVLAASKARANHLTKRLIAALCTAEQPGVSLRTHRELGSPRFRLQLTASELASLVAWPTGKGNGGIARQRTRLLPPLAGPAATRVFAESTHPDRPRPIGLRTEDALRHLHLLGPTGTGKSTVMLNLIVSDMVAGHSVVVVDPKGDLITDVLDRVPPSRIDDVVVVDGGDDTAPVGINGLGGAHQSESARELVADSMLSVFKGLYASSWGPRTEDVLHAALLTLGTRPDANLALLPLLLTNTAFRRSVTATITEPLVLEPFWRWYEALSEEQRAVVVAPLMNKLRAFLLRPTLRRIVSQPQPRFDIRSVFSQRKILLVSLSKGTLGPEGAALLGSVLVSQLWQAAQERTKVAQQNRRPVLIYLDEFQDYLHLPTDLASVLAQARGLNVGLNLAHQHLRQLPESMRSAVLSNARSRICFQLGSEDAAAMARTTPLLEPKDFQGLGAFEIYASLCSDGEVTDFVSARTNRPIAGNGRADEVRRRSRDRYGVPKDDIDRALLQHVTQKPSGGDIGRRSGRAS